MICAVLISLSAVSSVRSQTHFPDEKESAVISGAKVKSKTALEWNLKYVTEEDSGFKHFEYIYDNLGQLVYFTRNHVYPELSISEGYIYGSRGLPAKLSRINSQGDIFLEIDYVYNKHGKLKREQYTNYLNTVRTAFHFSIIANVNDDTVFSILQDELGIEPRLESYNITVNISDPNEENQYVVIGDEKDPDAKRYSWSLLSPEIQKVLLGWTGRNKTIHKTRTLYINEIVYRNDKNGNRLLKRVYDTDDDIIFDERYKYDGKGKLIERARYKESGIMLFRETYSYDEIGNVVEANSGQAATKYTYHAGNVAERLSYSNGKISGKDVYEYDVTGKLESITGYDASNNVYMRILYEYNEQGFISKMEYFDEEGKEVKIVRYDYQYYEEKSK